MKTAITALITIAALLGLALLVAATGLIEVAADRSHSSFTAWFLELARESSIEGELDTIQVPHLGPEHAARGALAYREMCAGCHGAPGSEPGVVGTGLNPAPPDLAAEDWSDREHQAEAFWVVKHGIRMTGMPAFGAAHDDDAMWDLVAFLEQLPELDRQGYERLTRTAPAGGGHAGHEHGHDEDAPRDQAPSGEDDGSEQHEQQHEHGDDHQHEHR
jgi:mono/diheme cytochrome c family protein